MTISKVRAATPRLGGTLGWIEHRRNQIDRYKDFQVAEQRIHGFQPFDFVAGEGRTQEGLVEVDFSLWFVDMPAMSFSASLVQPITDEGNLPKISVVVVDWVKERDNRAGGGYYTGATLAVVASGRSDEERMIVHWQAEAKALSGPVIGPT